MIGLPPWPQFLWLVLASLATGRELGSDSDTYVNFNVARRP